MTDDELIAALDHAASHWTDAQPDVAEAAAARIRELIAERDEALERAKEWERLDGLSSGLALTLRALLREARDEMAARDDLDRYQSGIVARIDAALATETAP